MSRERFRQLVKMVGQGHFLFEVVIPNHACAAGCKGERIFVRGDHSAHRKINKQTFQSSNFSININSDASIGIKSFLVEQYFMSLINIVMHNII